MVTRHRARFAKAARLADTAVFQKALRSGRRQQGLFFTVHRVANGRAGARLGMIVARRSAGTNVRRNHFKRLIREVFRLKQERLSGWDWVIRMREAPQPAQEPEAKSELERLLSLPVSPPGESAA